MFHKQMVKIGVQTKVGPKSGNKTCIYLTEITGFLDLIYKTSKRNKQKINNDDIKES